VSDFLCKTNAWYTHIEKPSKYYYQTNVCLSYRLSRGGRVAIAHACAGGVRLRNSKRKSSGMSIRARVELLALLVEAHHGLR
jgi:hypothetical protein